MNKQGIRFSGLPRPDYTGGGIVNVMSSIIRAQGGRSPHKALRGLPPERLRPYRRVVLLLLDGLGENQLQRALRRKEPPVFFDGHQRRVITTACPATTAAVVTTLATGASPAEHGVLGWHLHLPDLGMDGTILPFCTRTGTPIAPDDFDLARYLALPAPLASTRGKRVLISQEPLPVSRTSMAQDWWHERHSYTGLDGLLRRLKAFARKDYGRKAFAYAYWPHYDSLCHEFGPTGRRPLEHLYELGRFLKKLERAVAGTDTVVLVTADHGHMQTVRTVDLSAIPGFYGCLATLPSGDARAVQCFVRPDKVQEFLQLMQQAPLKEAGVAVPQAEVLSSGVLGPGKPHPALTTRLGDYMLFAAPGYGFQYPSAQAGRQKRMKGTHGGLSADELNVPLFVIHPD